MTGPEQSTTRKSFLGDVGVGDIKIVVTIILILDLINQVTNIWDQIVFENYNQRGCVDINAQVIWGLFLALRHYRVILYTQYKY